MVGRPALVQSASAEAFAAAAAEADLRSGTPHSYFVAHTPAGAAAENEYFGRASSSGVAISVALVGFWGEGPGGGQYENMVGPYATLGCGIFTDGASITVVQEFRASQ
jgi:hypothetical protein